MLDDASGKATADAAIQGGITKPCIIYMTNASGQSSRDNVAIRYEELGYDITLDIGFDNTTTVDYTSLVTKAMASDCNGVILAMTYQDAASAIATLKQNDYQYPISACSSLISTSVSDIIGDLADGVFGVADFLGNNDREETIAFVEGLSAVGTGEYTPSWIEASVYDVFLAITEAATIGGANTPEAIQESLYKIENLEGALGTLNYHDDHDFASYLYIGEFEGGVIVYKGTIDKPE
jgi:ABC-type branched-subunit amino acid transport system substrate-binding protein